jgi:hypothetical protein
MASFKYTFASGDTLTPARLNDARDVFDIVNADIKSDAAIAGTKIVPDFGSQNVTTTGSIGAGVTPAEKLHAYSSSSDCVILSQGLASSLGGTGKSAIQVDVNGTGGFALQTDSTSGTRLFRLISNTGYGAGETTAMAITPGANVGLGTSSPSQRLHTYHATSDCVIISQGRATSLGGSGRSAVQLDVDGTGGFALQTDSTSGTRLFRLISNTGYGAGETTAMAITPGANVGLGTASPAYRLHAYHATSDCVIISQGRATSSSGSGKAAVQIDVDGTGGFALQTDSSSGTRLFRLISNSGYGTGDTTALAVTSGGSVGVGTAIPSSKLHVAGDVTISSATTAASATAGAETLPANPVGFLVVSINGTSRKIPYYAT